MGLILALFEGMAANAKGKAVEEECSKQAMSSREGCSEKCHVEEFERWNPIATK